MSTIHAVPAESSASRPPRPAATLVVVRDGPQGVEALLLLRAERGDHNSGAWVFPGGLVDAADCDVRVHCSGPDDAAASARMHLPRGGLDYQVAALRECFEECGLLFALDGRTGAALPGSRTRTLWDWRGRLHRGETCLAEFLRAEDLRLDTERLAYLSHWLTPLGRAKRFDARFFVAVAPAGQEAAHDGLEMTSHRWMRPADALAAGDALKLMGPTRATLQTLADFADVASLMAWAHSPREVPRIFPRIGLGSKGERPVMPGEPAWVELGRLDPMGAGTASYDIECDRPVRLSAHVIRVTAGNAGVMTGPGTNTYLVGGGPRNEWAVIDPGPVGDAHVRAVVAAAPGPIRSILVTHTHSDHSPAAQMLRKLTGATVMGQLARHRDRQDETFSPDRLLSGGERLRIDSGCTLRVIHAPGHASNHLCYLLEEEKTLFTGDHVMQRSTVVINPPDGDMAAYIGSLRALSALCGTDIDWLAPGHGFLMDEPRRVFEWLIEHRLQREAKVIQALRELGPASGEALLARVYDDVPLGLHVVAMRSLLAHLFKLRDEGIASGAGGHWALLPR